LDNRGHYDVEARRLRTLAKMLDDTKKYIGDIIGIKVKNIYILYLGKNIVKGATQVSGHSLKLHFCMFEKSQGKHNKLDYYSYFGIFSINYKIYC
jgi:hypothetical protein